MSRHHLSRLVIEPKTSVLLHWCICACFGADFDLALVIDWYVAVYHFPVNFDHPLTNQFLRHPSRSYSHSRQSLRQAFSFAEILDCAQIDEVIERVLQLFLLGDLWISGNVPFCHVGINEMLVEPVETLEISSVFQLLGLPRQRTQFIPSYLLLLNLRKLLLKAFILISKLVKQHLVFLFLYGQPRLL
jgi:hypothetical protein